MNLKQIQWPSVLTWKLWIREDDSAGKERRIQRGVEVRDKKKGLSGFCQHTFFSFEFLLATYNLWVHETPSNPYNVFFLLVKAICGHSLRSLMYLFFFVVVFFHLHLHLNLSSGDSEQVMNLSFCICKMGIVASTLQSAYEHLS